MEDEAAQDVPEWMLSPRLNVGLLYFDQHDETAKAMEARTPSSDNDALFDQCFGTDCMRMIVIGKRSGSDMSCPITLRHEQFKPYKLAILKRISTRVKCDIQISHGGLKYFIKNPHRYIWAHERKWTLETLERFLAHEIAFCIQVKVPTPIDHRLGYAWKTQEMRSMDLILRAHRDALNLSQGHGDSSIATFFNVLHNQIAADEVELVLDSDEEEEEEDEDE